MNGITLVIREPQWSSLTALLSLTVESAAVLLAGIAIDENDGSIFVRDVNFIPEAEYLERTPWALTIRSGGYVRPLKQAANDGSIAIFFHTHPHGDPTASAADDRVDEGLQELFRIRTSQEHYASFILGGDSEAPLFTGQMVSAIRRRPITRVRVIGHQLKVLTTATMDEDRAAPFDRQIRAFGREGQRSIAGLRVGVVGAGGTGSAVCEQLLRLGVGHLTVVDSDRVTPTNITRVYGSGRRDIGIPKVEVVAESARHIGLGTTVTPVFGRVTERRIARTLRHCDIVFGCTDDHAGRAVLSRLAYWHLIPVIDMGVIITSSNGFISGLYGRITTVMPTTACLSCRRRIDPDMIRNEMLPEAERMRLAQEGYAPGLADPDPAVVVFTTLVAAVAMNELLERLIGYGQEDAPSELLIRLHDRQISRNRAPSSRDHYCADQRIWGRGDAEPFLGQTWLD